MATKTTTQKRKSAASETPPTKKPKTSKSAPAARRTTKSQTNKPHSTNEHEELILTNSASDSEDSAAEDQTAALLKGFESASSESEADSNADKDSATSKPLDLSLLPDPTTSLSKHTAQDAAAPTGPTVLYISRVPHGFHEAQMSGYFSQFGTLTHLRLARNRRTGRSKHYAFLQFEDADVADIVARTMNNYLLFGHLLKCRLVPWDDVARMGGVEGLFRGSGRRWKKVPWNAIERSKLQKADRKGWKKRVEGEERRRRVKMEKMKELGYVFEAPAIKAVDEVPVRRGEKQGALMNAGAGAIEGIAATDETQVEVDEDPATKVNLTVENDAAKSSSNKPTKKKKTRT